MARGLGCSEAFWIVSLELGLRFVTRNLFGGRIKMQNHQVTNTQVYDELVNKDTVRMKKMYRKSKEREE